MASLAETVSQVHLLLVVEVEQAELVVRHPQAQAVSAFRSIHLLVVRHCLRLLEVVQVLTLEARALVVQVLQQRQPIQQAVVVVPQAVVQVRLAVAE